MNIRQVRKKIKSVGNVKKITRAMQLVSAVKMKKYQQVALDSSSYQEALTSMIKKIGNQTGESQSKYLQKNVEVKQQLVILLSSNKGLCGGFNVNLFRFLLRFVDLKSTQFITIGRKGSEFVRRFGGSLVADFSTTTDVDTASAVFEVAASGFLEGKYSSVSIFYNKFISPIRFEPTQDSILPLSALEEEKEQVRVVGEYLIEPSADEILDELFKSYIEETIRYAKLQNQAGEHSARMLAMKSATDNATELVYNLTLLRNRIRQQNITYELLDMVTAQQAV